MSTHVSQQRTMVQRQFCVSWRLSYLMTNAINFVLTAALILCSYVLVHGQHYQQTNLVSDIPGLAAHTDPHLVNPWGITASPTSPWWVADNGTGVSTLYNGAGVPQSLVVTVPPPTGQMGPSTPTGIVFNGSSDFEVGPMQPARFIFVTEDGTISGWNPGANPTNAILKVNNAGLAIYKGATLAQRNGANFLYVANFFNGSVDVFDKDWVPVVLPPGAFRDPRLPEHFAPFNVQVIEGKIFVAFAQQSDDRTEDVDGPGLGYVDAFDANGVLLMRLKHGRWMNAPWGVALAPEGFGKLSDRLLIGQFGSGEIATFDPDNGNFHGLLRGRHGQSLQIDGLWALRFGNGAAAGPTTTLFFSAGIDDEEHGLFGTITPISHDDDDDDG